MGMPLSQVRSVRYSLLRFGDNRTGRYDELRMGKPGSTHAANPDYPSCWKPRTPDAMVLDTLVRFVQPGEPVVELGCNSGNNLLPLAERYPMYGVDLSAKPLRALKEKASYQQNAASNVHTAVWDFAQDGDLPPQWDAIKGQVKGLYAVQVFSHLTDEGMRKAVQGLKNYLAPGAVVIFTNIEQLPPESKNWTSTRDWRLIDGGANPHSTAAVMRAFEGFDLIESRPFQPHEGGTDWFKSVPGMYQHLRWYVFRKPGQSR